MPTTLAIVVTPYDQAGTFSPGLTCFDFAWSGPPTLTLNRFRSVAQRDAVRLQVAVAPHEQGDFVADLHLRYCVTDLIGGRHLLMVELQDDVACLQACFVSRALRNHISDDDALRAVVSEVVGDLRVERPHLDPDEGVLDVDA